MRPKQTTCKSSLKKKIIVTMLNYTECIIILQNLGVNEFAFLAINDAVAR